MADRRAAVQHFCAVVRADSSSSVVTHYSANVFELAGTDASADEYFASPRNVYDVLAMVLELQEPKTQPEYFKKARFNIGGRHVETDAIEEPGAILFAIVAIPHSHADDPNLCFSDVDDKSTDNLLASVVDAVRHAGRFDRVVVYKFDADCNGIVEHEAKSATMHSILGLQRPHTDIPPFARKALMANGLRVLFDVRAPNVEIRPTAAAVDDCDLCSFVFRGTNNCHLQYLKSMGVRGSCSFAIDVADRLWGLVICHNVQPAFLTMRTLDRILALVKRTSLAITANYVREYERYIGSLCHEVRTPLNGIIAMSTLLDDTDDAVLRRECIDTIRSSAAHLLALVETLKPGAAKKSREESDIVGPTRLDDRAKCIDVSAPGREPSKKPSATRARLSETMDVGRVLAVDDNIVNLRVAGRLLSREGIAYDTASDGMEAVLKCSAEHYDILLLDIEMPIKNGIDAARDIRNAGSDVFIVALTATASADMELRCKAAGMDMYLNKPLTREKLAAVFAAWKEPKRETDFTGSWHRPTKT